MKKEYFELHLPTAGFDTDILSAELHNAGCMGIYEKSDDDWIVYLPGDWTPEHHQNVVAVLQRLNPAFDVSKLIIEKLPYQNWNAEWRKYFKPVQIGEKLWVRPPWENLPDGATGEAIIIDPQMAFGTGHHETTKLMIQLMQSLDLQEKAILDLGTGSGILAIAARKLGATSVIGIDIDPEAIENAEHNLQLNKTNGVEVYVGNISYVVGQKFPVILANIQFHILEPIADALYECLQNEGKLLISGILATEAERFIGIFRRTGFTLESQSTLGEWSGILFTK